MATANAPRTRQTGLGAAIGTAQVPTYPGGLSAPCGAVDRADRWHLLLLGLQGKPWPALPELPGVVHACRDDVIGEDERAEILASAISDAEAALLLGLTRQRIHQLRAEQAQKDDHEH